MSNRPRRPFVVAMTLLLSLLLLGAMMVVGWVWSAAASRAEVSAAALDRSLSVPAQAVANVVTPLLMYSFSALLKRRLAKSGIDFLQLDLMTGLAEMYDYDPSTVSTCRDSINNS